MNGINQCNFIGNLGADPELREAGERKVATLSLGVSESWKDKSGNRQERTEWVRCICWDRLAEIAGEYCGKGSKLYISGKMQTRKWTDREGNDKYTTEIIVRELRMLNRIEHGEKASAPAPAAAAADFEDDIPF